MKTHFQATIQFFLICNSQVMSENSENKTKTYCKDNKHGKLNYQNKND